MNLYSTTFSSELSIEDLLKKIKSYKSSTENRYYLIHTEDDNHIVFGKFHSLIFNFLDSIDTEFKIYKSNTNNIYRIDSSFSGYKIMHYIFIIFFLFFVFFFNTFIFFAIIGITGHKFYFCYLITVFIALYVLSKKPIIIAIKNEIKFIKRILKYYRQEL